MVVFFLIIEYYYDYVLFQLVHPPTININYFISFYLILGYIYLHIGWDVPLHYWIREKADEMAITNHKHRVSS